MPSSRPAAVLGRGLPLLLAALLLAGCGGGTSAQALPSAPPAPVSSPAWEQPLSPSSLPAMQLNPSADATRAWLFANILRGREAWILPPAGLDPAEADALAATVQVDEDGFPRALPEGCRLMIQASCETGRALEPTSGESRNTCLRGAFVLTWEGRGRVRLDSSQADGKDERILLNAPNRIVLVLTTPFKGQVVQVLETDPADPVRHLRLWPPAWDGAGVELTADSPLGPGQIPGNLEPAPGQPEPLFHPRYLQHLSELPDAGVLRMMGFLETNGIQEATPITWEDRGHATGITGSLSVVDRSWGRHGVPAFRARAGVAYEWLIDLCNQTHRDLWLNVPHTASPDLVENLAGLVARRLDPDLRVWVEFSNELWNSASSYLPQHELAKARAARHFGLPPEELTFEQVGFGSGLLQGDCLQAFEDAWRAAGQPDSRMINVVAGFALSPSFNRSALEGAREVGAALPEVLAISNYFGDGRQFEIYDQHRFGEDPGNWPAALFEGTARIVRRVLLEAADAWSRNASLAREFGVPLVGYEGGQHMLAMGLGDWGNPSHVDFMNFLMAFERSPEMKALYQEQYALWSVAGGRTVSVFQDVGPWSFWGYWGAKEYVTQTRSDSARWDAIVSWGGTQRGVRAPGDPQGTAPELQEATLRAEVGRPFSADLEATGGEGTVTLSVLAGALPPGIALEVGASGRATLSGTPTRAGRYDVYFRARDGDGDVSDRLLPLLVDPEGVQDHALVQFRGADLPASPPGPNNTGGGRYDPVRPILALDGGARLCLPFSLEDPIFGTECLAPNVLPGSSPLNMYGGWSLAAQDGPTRVAEPQPSSWTGLRSGKFVSWSGDAEGPTLLEGFCLWRTDQFSPLGGSGAYTFGDADATATLQADLTDLCADGSNEVRFVVLDREAGEDRWFLSEAAWTACYPGDGIFRVQGFQGSSEPGRRWATFTPPSGTEVRVPAGGLDFQPRSFLDVQALGLAWRVTRPRWHFAFGFHRFLALGERR